jgi:hypothetical protein
MAALRAWPARGAPVERMIVLDRRGALRPVLESLPERAAVPASAAEIEELCGRFVNWLILAHHACPTICLPSWTRHSDKFPRAMRDSQSRHR